MSAAARGRRAACLALASFALVALAADPAPPVPAAPAPRQALAGEARAAFLRKIESRMAGIRSLAAEFKQEKRLRVFKQPVVSQGLLVFARPDGLRWEITGPFRSLLVVSGRKAGKFEYTEGRRRALKIEAAEKGILSVMDQIRGWFAGKFDTQGDVYDMEVFDAPAPSIVLRPRHEALRKSVQEIDVTLAPDLATVAVVTLIENQGDRTEMRFTELRRDAAFPQELFSVSDPAETSRDALAKAPALPPPAPAKN